MQNRNEPKVASRNDPTIERSQDDRSPAHILVVEDGPSTQKLFALILRRAGAEVVTAENGQVAVDIAQQETFDAILMDIQMPVMDGYTATSKLRELGFTVPIIALTAEGGPDAEAKCRAAGCSDCLTKPVRPEHLLQMLADIVGAKAEGTSDTARPLEHVETSTPKPRKAPTAPPTAADRSRIVSTLPLEDPRLRAIVRGFIGHMHDRLGVMRQAQNQKNFDQLAKMAHWLRGATSNMGFNAFADPASELEQLAKTGRLDEIESVMGQLEELLNLIDVPTDEATAQSEAVDS